MSDSSPRPNRIYSSSPGQRKYYRGSASKRLNDVGMRLLIICTRVCSFSHQHVHLEVMLSRWSIETYSFITFWGEFTRWSRMSSRRSISPIWRVKWHRQSSWSWKRLEKDEVLDDGDGRPEVIRKVCICFTAILLDEGGKAANQTLEWKFSSILDIVVCPFEWAKGWPQLAINITKVRSLSYSFVSRHSVSEAGRKCLEYNWVGCYAAMTHTDSSFLQMFPWERLASLALNPSSNQWRLQRW